MNDQMILNRFDLRHLGASRYIWTGLALGLCTLGGCDKKKAAPDKSAQKAKVPPPSKAQAKPETQAKAPAPVAPRAPLAIASAQAKFATNLFGQVAKGMSATDNYVISPMSVYVALGMTRLGAKGPTATAMDQTLSLPKDSSAPSIAKDLGQSQRRWTQARPKTTLAIANRLFADESFKIKPAFVQMTKSQLGAEIQNLAIARAPDKARKAINQWVAEQTKNRIQELLAPPNVTPDTRMVLVNAIWFKGDWAHPFSAKKTKRRPFFIRPKKSIKVKTMEQTQDLPFLAVKSEGFSVVDLPYADGQLAMSLILPDKDMPVDKLASNIDLQSLSKGLSKAMPRRVDLQVPKFTIDPSTSMSLRPQLSNMGAKTIFGDPKPDFTAMADASEKLAIQDVVHKAMIIVDEKGSEAAAATAVTTYRSASVPQVTTLKFNRPFLFMIRDKKDGAILFAGQVAKPKS